MATEGLEIEYQAAEQDNFQQFHAEISAALTATAESQTEQEEINRDLQLGAGSLAVSAVCALIAARVSYVGKELLAAGLYSAATLGFGGLGGYLLYGARKANRSTESNES